jgi:hypothetical protein
MVHKIVKDCLNCKYHSKFCEFKVTIDKTLNKTVACEAKKELEYTFEFNFMLRKTALKRLNVHNHTGELVAERVEAERCLWKIAFVSLCTQGQNQYIHICFAVCFP